MKTLFEQLNAPFQHADYEYNKEDSLTYIKGQAVAERLNEVLGVGYWSYEPIQDSVKVVDTGRKNKHNQPILMLTLLVKFNFYNKELKEWVSFVDAGSQDMNARMAEGDATKSAITDGMKKCASRIGVASDLYKGMIKAVNGQVVLPANYKEYYKEKGWQGVFEGITPQYKPKTETKTDTKPEGQCSECNAEIKPAVKTFSEKKYGKPLCMDCQKKAV